MRRFPAAIVVALLLLGPVAPAAAKSYRFARIDVDITVLPDGTMQFREQRTFDFDGSFSFAWIDIARGGAPEDPAQDPRSLRYTVRNASVSEGDTVFTEVPPSSETRSNTFWFAEGAEGWRIQWHYRALDERRTFGISYDVAGHIVAYDDVAELFWRFVGDDRGAPTDEFVARVHLPDWAAPGEVRAWGRGPLEGEVTIVSPREIVWRAPRLGNDENVVGRVAFPSSLVPDAVQGRGARLPSILRDEQRLADEANAARARSRWLNIGALLAGIASFAVFMLLFAAYGKEHDVGDPGRYLRDLPHDYPPAIVGYLMRFGEVKPLDMVSTLMDLARRGYLTIGEIREDRGVFSRKADYEFTITVVRDDLEGLTLYEAEVLRLLIGAGARDGVSARGLKDWAKADPSSMQKRFTEFKESVKDHAHRLGLVEARLGVMSLNLLVIIGAGALGVFTVVSQGDSTILDSFRNAPGAWLAFVILTGQLALTRTLRQRTREGARHHARWEAFRRFLKDFGRMHEYRPPAVTMWERYLVYAVPLDAAEAVAEAIKIHAPAEIAERGFSWYGFSDGHAGGFAAMDGRGFAGSVGGITSSLTASAEAAFSTAPSSGSGGGGGFSGGGGGGSGGGGSSGAG